MTTLVFVHGWSVTNTSTYGRMPEQVQQQAAAAGIALTLADIRLSEYVSFDDAVTMADLVRAFDHALRELQLTDTSFACIAHSLGGPVVREWLRAQRERPGRMSPLRLTHLVMLAPANFGSALAQLGKSALGKLKAWWEGIEPGQRLLDWLELGSPASLSLNLDTIHGDDPAKRGQFAFVLTGDRPDRALYDHLNSYTGEDGSDGVVRIASANLNARHAVLSVRGSNRAEASDVLALTLLRGPRFAFKLLPGASHGGDQHGILRRAAAGTVEAIVRCLGVRDADGYRALCDAFDRENALRDANKVELEPAGPFPPRVHIHDPCSQLILRLTDESGEAMVRTRLLLTAGPQASPDQMPPGFMLDRQANSRQPATITLFLNHALLAGDPQVADPRADRGILRQAVTDHRPYGALVQPPDLTGLIHHALAHSAPDEDLFALFGAHQTTVLDVTLPRRVREGVFRLTSQLAPQDFAKPVEGVVIL